MHLRRLTWSLMFSAALAGAPMLQAKTAPPDHWVGTWATAPVGQPNQSHVFNQDTTLREIVHISLGGQLLRITLSNEFGTEPLRVGAVHVAMPAGAGAISLATANALTFGGRTAVTIPAGALVVSDPFALSVKPQSDLAVSLFLPAQTISTLTLHQDALQTNYLATGDVVGQATLPNPQPLHTWPFLKGVDTRVGDRAAAVVCLGDSITDGAKSTRDTNSRWPNILAQRLQQSHRHRNLAVLNEGIGGNRVLLDGNGPNVLARLDRDVLAQSGVRYLILLEGINDVGAGYKAGGTTTTPPPTAQDLIAAFQQIIVRAHTHNISVIGATLTPYTGAGYASPAGEQVRSALNEWIRNGKAFDGVIDFDAITRDKNRPLTLSPLVDSGDHLHPSDAGYKEMGNAIDLGLFDENKKNTPPKAKLAPPSRVGDASSGS